MCMDVGTIALLTSTPMALMESINMGCMAP